LEEDALCRFPEATASGGSRVTPGKEEFYSTTRQGSKRNKADLYHECVTDIIPAENMIIPLLVIKLFYWS